MARKRTMQPTADYDASKLARSLLRRSRQGALATLMVGSGDPYCSLVNVASHFDGSPILLISRLALHTKNIFADARVSLMLDERAEGDPLEGARIMLAGRAEEVLQAEPSAVAHMNEDHREAMDLYATRLLGADSADWRCTGCDPDGIDMQAGSKTLRLDFPERLTSGTDLRKMLVRLASEA